MRVVSASAQGVTVWHETCKSYRGSPAVWAGMVSIVRSIIQSICRGGMEEFRPGLVTFRNGFAHSHADVEEVGLNGHRQARAWVGGP